MGLLHHGCCTTTTTSIYGWAGSTPTSTYMNTGPPSSGPGKGGLLDQIHEGRQLNKVEVNEKPADGDGRDDVLSAIRKGCQLKTVSQSEMEQDHSSSSDLDEIAGALAKPLAQ
ncbi:actin nucleation-promoting factor WASL-like [Hydractinia symbiolongicarpus]|uniref:actin nucleation-promoting factor WASL-like n=1 Tax=Hydractinia symbiolongicarpus TaxID=13093 RepID=UPI00254D74CB|nr:actin nucleation-promoting factor WASL-like [Hydractinia symbiolongicarpus]